MRVLWIQVVLLSNEFCFLLSLGTIIKATKRLGVEREELRLSLNRGPIRLMNKKKGDVLVGLGVNTKFTSLVKAPIAISRNYEPLIQDHRIVKRNASFIQPGNEPKTTTPQTFTLSSTPPHPNCKPERSCSGRCIYNRTEWRTRVELTCSCDPDCYEVFNDCCADYGKYCGFQKRTNVLTKKYNWTCEKVGYYDSKYCAVADGVWMVSRCADGWPDDNTRTKCETPLTKLTISSQDLTRFLPFVGQDNVTFRNLHCALCNKVTDFYEQWPLNVETTVIPPENYNLTQKIQFLLSHAATFPVKDELSPKSSHARRYCVNEKARNPHLCFLRFRGTCRGFTPQSFSLVLDFRRNTQNSKMEKYKFSLKQEECGKQGMIFDDILQACRVNWSDPPDQNDQDRFYVVAWLEPPKLSQDNVISRKDFKNSFVEYFNVSDSQILDVNISSIVQSVPRAAPQLSLFLVTSTVILSPQQSLELSSTNRNAYNALKPNLLNFIYFKEPLTMNIRNSNYTIIKTTSRPLSCVGRKLYEPNEYTLLDEDKVYINSTNITYGKLQYFRENSQQSTLGNITICEKYIPIGCNMTWTKLAPTKFTIMTNLSIYHNETAITYHYGQYDILSNGSVAVCVSPYTKPPNSDKTLRHDRVLGWITFVCFLISILFLIFLLVTYILFAQLRTLPGKNLMNLAASLLMFKLFWILLSSSDLRNNVSVCTATAVLEHYFLLCYFASMSVIAFHTCQVFARQLPAPKSSISHEKKLFILYFVLVWLIPGIFVIICFILDKKKIMNVGYGDSGTCWVNEKNAYIYIVTLPILLLLLLNIVAFIRTVIYLRKHGQNSAALQASGVRRSNLSIYIKLSTLMGFTWLFGLLAYVAEPSILYWYLFVILTSLQGFFITVAFVLNRKTLRIYRKSPGRIQEISPPNTTGRNLATNISDETKL